MVVDGARTAPWGRPCFVMVSGGYWRFPSPFDVERARDDIFSLMPAPCASPGGPGFAVTFGLLVLGVSLAGGLTRRLSSGVMWFGIVLGVIAELSSLSRSRELTLSSARILR